MATLDTQMKVKIPNKIKYFRIPTNNFQAVLTHALSRGKLHSSYNVETKNNFKNCIELMQRKKN